MTEQEYSQRRARLRDLLCEAGIEGLLVFSPANIRYLCGFTGSNGLLVATASETVLLTDPRYEIQAAEQTGCTVKVVRGPLVRAVGPLLRKFRVARAAFESAHIRYSTYLALEEYVAGSIRLNPVQGMVEQLRSIKSETEIELIRASMQTCETAFSRVIRKAKPGMSETELAAEFDHQMRKLGAERPAFDTIVASGPRSALPHAEPSDRLVQANELLLVDMGASRNGYASDMTRVAWFGKPTKKISRLYGAVLEAQLAALDHVRAGRSAAAVDRRARQVLKSHGLDGFFTHSTGHGLGLEIHEAPRLAKVERRRLEAGMVITIEPGVYMERFGGVRIEDTIVVTRTGCEILTRIPKELMEL